MAEEDSVVSDSPLEGTAGVEAGTVCALDEDDNIDGMKFGMVTIGRVADGNSDVDGSRSCKKELTLDPPHDPSRSDDLVAENLTDACSGDVDERT